MVCSRSFISCYLVDLKVMVAVERWNGVGHVIRVVISVPCLSDCESLRRRFWWVDGCSDDDLVWHDSLVHTAFMVYSDSRASQPWHLLLLRPAPPMSRETLSLFFSTLVLWRPLPIRMCACGIQTLRLLWLGYVCAGLNVMLRGQLGVLDRH